MRPAAWPAAFRARRSAGPASWSCLRISSRRARALAASLRISASSDADRLLLPLGGIGDLQFHAERSAARMVARNSAALSMVGLQLVHRLARERLRPGGLRSPAGCARISRSCCSIPWIRSWSPSETSERLSFHRGLRHELRQRLRLARVRQRGGDLQDARVAHQPHFEHALLQRLDRPRARARQRRSNCSMAFWNRLSPEANCS